MVPRPEDSLHELAESDHPWLIGVRHHSAALARVMPTLLDGRRPDAVLIELPPEFASWLPILGRDDVVAPVALAASHQSRLLSFYPMADFSPELAAIRWAVRTNTPVIACDLDLVSMPHFDDYPIPGSRFELKRASATSQALQRLLSEHESADTGELWESLVETPSLSNDAESIRRAALYFGWAVRESTETVCDRDLRRERAMRTAIRTAPANAVAVVGAFHAPAICGSFSSSDDSPEQVSSDHKNDSAPTTSLVGYSFAQLDQRSGYPAGIMDPVWQQLSLEATNTEQAERVLSDLAVRLCRELRMQGHVAGSPDAMELVRLASDLARLRGHSAAGRREFLESVQTTLVQGDLFGRGRAVASAAQNVLIGNRRGRLPNDLPRSGLSVEIACAFERAKLPAADSIDDPAKEMRLDPLRSKLDRVRSVTLRRMNLIGVRYAQRIDNARDADAGQRENLTEVWQVNWDHATEATIESAGMRGVTIWQACESAVNDLRHPDDTDLIAVESRHPGTLLKRFAAAAECGLPDRLWSEYKTIEQIFHQVASTQQIVQMAQWIDRIVAGHLSGVPIETGNECKPDVVAFELANHLNATTFLKAAVASLEGMIGSRELSDVQTVRDLSMLVFGERSTVSLLQPTFESWLLKARRKASALMQGAAWAISAHFQHVTSEQLAAVQRGWFAAAGDSESRQRLTDRLQGMLAAMVPLVLSDPCWLDGLHEALCESPDDEFLARLPAMRSAFTTLLPFERASVLRDRLVVIDPSGASVSARRFADPEQMAINLQLDNAGAAAVRAPLPDLELKPVSSPTSLEVSSKPDSLFGSGKSKRISIADRWHLVLGVRDSASPQSVTHRARMTLDELYGSSIDAAAQQRPDLFGPGGGGRGQPSPSPRQWATDVQGLFGKDVCEEVLGAAAAGGRAAMLEYLNADTVRPSVTLLEQVLSLRGAMAERNADKLRTFARKITQRLAKQLAVRLRPALHGLSIPRPTRRRSPRVAMKETIRRNLRTAHVNRDGRIGIAAEQMVFRSAAKRQMDWDVIFVVDVSGSMEASVIYSALVAAIFHALPAIDVRFFAFSTEVIDFSDSVEDPLSLLMEVQVGGGTHIGLGLRAARQAIKHPTRTIVILVSDFEEGVSTGEMTSEINELSSSGVRLIGLASLDDEAKPRYCTAGATAAAAAGMNVAAVSPERLAEWVGDQIRGAAR